eukprot:TRINITY_DN7194_c0_g1_i1.p1 TRINITY_DN7194_c0_g1~~TRINITY_DN7194_c0_g1_i1.p1  ORF type:complete len:150 (-),score=51.74 TRINITY_DN7194_c0_g1_i1:112-561(-)
MEIKNSMTIFCSVCGCTILLPQHASLLKRQLCLPTSKKNEEGIEEELGSFWWVKNMMHFENIAFSKTVGQKKFLTCAECELGIVGVQLLDEENAFFIAHERVSYDAARARDRQAQLPPSAINPANLAALMANQQGGEKREGAGAEDGDA